MVGGRESCTRDAEDGLGGTRAVQLLLQVGAVIQGGSILGLQLHDLALELVAVALQLLHLLLQHGCSLLGRPHLHTIVAFWLNT